MTGDHILGRVLEVARREDRTETLRAVLEGVPWVARRDSLVAYERGAKLRTVYQAFRAGLDGRPFTSESPVGEPDPVTDAWIHGCRLRRRGVRTLQPLEAFERALATGAIGPDEETV
jgi:hypothetical protein